MLVIGTHSREVTHPQLSPLGIGRNIFDGLFAYFLLITFIAFITDRKE